MSGPESNKPDDRLLEEFLAGEGAVRSVYRATAREQAPAALDAAILQAAEAAEAAEAAVRAPVARPVLRRVRWTVPLAAAAVLVLSFGVFLETQRDPVAQKEIAVRPATAAAENVGLAAVAVQSAEVARDELAVAAAAPAAMKPKAEKRAAEAPKPPPPPVADAAPAPAPAPAVQAAPAEAAPELRRAREERAAMVMQESERADAASAGAAPMAKSTAKAFATPAPAPTLSVPEPARNAAAAPAAAGDQPAPANCGDFLERLSRQLAALEYLGCTATHEGQVAVLKARYRVAGGDAAKIESALMADARMPALRYLCCGWESAEGGHYANPANAKRPYAVSMGSGDTKVNQREDWQRIPYFSVTVTLPLESP